MPIYDGSHQDIANRLRDDDLISNRLLLEAAKRIEEMAAALEKIVSYDGQPEASIVCQHIAKEALR